MECHCKGGRDVPFSQPYLLCCPSCAVMEEGGYAANGIKHCVRPMDMSGG